MSDAAPVVVEAPARLHFGVLDLRGDLGRRFGGIGAAVPVPSLLLEARRAPALTAEGPDADRALAFARRFAAYHRLDARVRFCLHRTIPAHAGLGSGTQLALAVARATAELYGLPTAPAALARAVDRGRRSAVGTWTFAAGGFVLEGGHRSGDDGIAPLVVRLPIPASWRCVVAVPLGKPGLAGDEEAAAFARLPPAPAREVERVAHLVLLQLLPALARAIWRTLGPPWRKCNASPVAGSRPSRAAGSRRARRGSSWSGCANGERSAWGKAPGDPPYTGS